MPTINKKPILVINLTKERNKERHKFYNNSQWRNLRKIYLQSHPLCEECLKSDVITPSSDVHHLQSPFEANLNDMERWRRLLDYGNLEAVCKDCHGRIHADKQKKLKKVDGLFEKIPKK